MASPGVPKLLYLLQAVMISFIAAFIPAKIKGEMRIKKKAEITAKPITTRMTM